MTQSIFIIAWFVAVIAWFIGMRAFMPWCAKVRGAEPPEDALGKTLYAFGILAVAAAVGLVAAAIGAGNW
jgi:hypothetical protein